jgi:hypothetical protein
MIWLKKKATKKEGHCGTSLTTEPASPPAIRANPTNRNNLAFQTKLSPE